MDILRAVGGEPVVPPFNETVYAAAGVQVTETWPMASTLALSIPFDPKSTFWVDTRQLAATVAFIVKVGSGATVPVPELQLLELV
ncbi:hypothetical protein AJ88_24220 [Mesorhizobium amorphae CCBAU 01583]|nr:hypothetical protein AJ88_24220 [Mesorhizobium amorphae CCBAU 01583]